MIRAGRIYDLVLDKDELCCALLSLTLMDFECELQAVDQRLLKDRGDSTCSVQ